MLSTSRRSRTSIFNKDGVVVGESLDVPLSDSSVSYFSGAVDSEVATELSSAILELAKSPTLEISPTVETLLEDFCGLIDHFVELLQMIIDAIIKALSQLIDSLFGQLTSTAHSIAQYLEMTPEEHLARFMEHMKRIGDFVRETCDKGFPYTAVDPIKVLRDAQLKLNVRSKGWFDSLSAHSLVVATPLSVLS
jgi:hypothetical protein